MPAEVLIPLPDGVSDRTASTLMMKGMTAQYLFRQVFPLKGGETILYHAAAGGVGLIACQWARAMGVHMIGTVSTDEKAEIAKAQRLRAHHRDLAREHRAARARDHRRQGRAGGLRLGGQGHAGWPRSTACSRAARWSATAPPPARWSSTPTLLAAKGSIWLTRPAMMHYIQPRAHMLEMAKELFGHVLAGSIAANRGRASRWPTRPRRTAHSNRAKTTGATVLVP